MRTRPTPITRAAVGDGKRDVILLRLSLIHISDRRLGRGGLPTLVEAVEIWVEHWNDDPKPFIWHKAANDIIEKVRRGRLKLHQINPATDN